MRDAIIAGAPDKSSALVDLASNKDTVLREVPASALKGWKVLDLVLNSVPRPRRATVGLADDGRVVILMGQPQNFATLLEGAAVTTQAQAIEVVQAYLATTGDLSQPAYPIASIEQVKFLPRPNADQVAQMASLKADYAAQVAAPVAQQSATGWTVVTWWVSAGQLVKHETTVTADGALHDSPSVVEDRLPVPVSP